jgi:protein-tyrosine-phosphatase
VLACYLYRHLSGGPALSAGMEAGDCINDRALAMLSHWEIDARQHRPQQIRRELCDEADAIFMMAPTYLRRLLLEAGPDLAAKTHLFADPFRQPGSFASGEFRVRDPSFDECPIEELVREFTWMRERVLDIRQALEGIGRPLVPANRYLTLLQTLDPMGH